MRGVLTAVSSTFLGAQSDLSDPLAITGPAPVNTALPTITGQAKVGAVLAATNGTWTGDEGFTASFEWLRNGLPIAGATDDAYQITAADHGASIAVKVTLKSTGYASATQTSNATATVADGDFLNVTPVTISGTAQVGATLTATPGAWAPAPTTRSYQWRRDGAPIVGATGTTYTAVAADAGTVLTVTESVTGTHLIGVPVTSVGVTVAAAPVTAAPQVVPAVNTKVPAVRGKAKVGRKLVASAGSWNAPGHTFRYQWLRNGKPIAKATKSSYKLTKKDKKKRISVRVTAVRSGYPSVSATSRATGRVK